jgi:hypothetical protein
MPRIVHVGGGKTVTIASSAFDDPAFARPRKNFIPRRKVTQRAHTGGDLHRKPVVDEQWFLPVTDRECTWSSDGGCREPHEPGKHYCERHDALAHGCKP